MTWGSGYGRRWVKEDILQWHYGFILNDENLAYVDDVTHSLQTQEWTATLCWLNMLPPNPPTASPWRANYLPNLPEFHLSKWCSKAQWEENSSFSHVLLQIHNRFWTVSYKIISLVRKVWSVGVQLSWLYYWCGACVLNILHGKTQQFNIPKNEAGAMGEAHNLRHREKNPIYLRCSPWNMQWLIWRTLIQFIKTNKYKN